MIHNPPFSLEHSLSTERPFADVLKQTYSLLDGTERKLREDLVKTIERFAVDPADAISWRAESAVENQTTLSLLIEASIVLAKAESLEALLVIFDEFCKRYTGYVVSWAHQGETSTSAFSNITSRATLAATAKVFGSWGLASEIERSITHDIEESKKRVVVCEFVDLNVDEWFRASPDLSSMVYRKLSPRKAIEGVYPVNKAQRRAFSPRDQVYVFRVPLEADVLYAAEAA